MPFWRTFYHLVWTTKNREPWITPNLEPRLYTYIVRKAAELDVHVYAINGWTDHLHLVVAIPPHVAVADLVKLVKGASSHDLNHQGLGFRFAWQRGYGVLTLGQRQKPDAVAYVEGQKEHHGKNTIIPWLENCAEYDEGPDDHKPVTASSVPAIREVSPAYCVNDDPVF